MIKLYPSLLLIGISLLFQSDLFSQVTEVNNFGFTVADMDRSVKFYTEVLSFQKVSDEEYFGEAYEDLTGVFGLHIRVVRMKLGNEEIQLTDYLTAGGKSIPEDSRSNDLWFQHIAIVVSDMDKAYQQLRKYNVEHVSTVPQTIPVSNKGAAGIRAFYFHDPDNHNLELIYFPPGKGDQKWQRTDNRLFLGIDHTAIAVSSTAASLKFYQDALGLTVKGEGYNYGIEQSRLNNVENDSLHLTALRSPKGAGVEFLEYLKPLTGKRYPSDAKPDDLIFWHTTVKTGDARLLHEKLISANYKIISRKLVVLTDTSGVKHHTFMVRDPDGHAVLVTD